MARAGSASRRARVSSGDTARSRNGGETAWASSRLVVMICDGAGVAEQAIRRIAVANARAEKMFRWTTVSAPGSWLRSSDPEWDLTHSIHRLLRECPGPLIFLSTVDP